MPKRTKSQPFETIAVAALQIDGVTLSMPRPARHHTVFHAIDGWWGHLDYSPPHKQGFVTSEGRFVERKEAAKIAETAGQIIKKHGPKDELFSEDCW